MYGDPKSHEIVLVLLPLIENILHHLTSKGDNFLRLILRGAANRNVVNLNPKACFIKDHILDGSILLYPFQGHKVFIKQPWFTLHNPIYIFFTSKNKQHPMISHVSDFKTFFRSPHQSKSSSDSLNTNSPPCEKPCCN